MAHKYSKEFETNRQLWEGKTPIHLKSDFYDLEAFKKGKTSLMPIELEELGDVSGKSLLHLQCHFGQDTLSWAREGATVTGMDFSPAAIEAARGLRDELDLDAKFVCCNIYDLREHLEGEFDIVFTSYGTITWLPDLDEWASIVSHFLKKGGTFYIAEFHPVIWMFDDDLNEISYPYHNIGKPFEETIEGTYADKDADLKAKEYFWNHALSETINALINQGIQIEFLHEFNYSPYNVFPGMVKNEQGFWEVEKFGGKVPHMFSLKAHKR